VHVTLEACLTYSVFRPESLKPACPPLLPPPKKNTLHKYAHALTHNNNNNNNNSYRFRVPHQVCLPGSRSKTERAMRCETCMEKKTGYTHMRALTKLCLECHHGGAFFCAPWLVPPQHLLHRPEHEYLHLSPSQGGHYTWCQRCPPRALHSGHGGRRERGGQHARPLQLLANRRLEKSSALALGVRGHRRPQRPPRRLVPVSQSLQQGP
jgi:hypothetical protein